MNSRSLKTEFGKNEKVDKHVQNKFLQPAIQAGSLFGGVSRNRAREARRCECDGLCRFLARSLLTGFASHESLLAAWIWSQSNVTFWGKLMLSVVLQVTGRNLSMELEVTLPPYMDTVNLILNILRVEQFDFCQYGAKRTSVRSQPILTHATQNFFPKNRRDLDFHEHLLSRNFNYDLCKCRIVLPPRLLVKCK